jgi:glycosyltransferase involved in cell wall biosynthesis
VQFLGFESNPYPAITQADLLVSASRYEGFSNAIIEAFACGTPVVATDCPSANREVLEEGLNGWLSPADDAQALAQTICRAIVELPSLERQMIKDRCEARFSARTILQHYETLLSGARP